jgi:alpha-amylase
MERHQPGFLEELRERVEEGRVEMLTGGYYEPILAAIPARDADGQIGMMSRYLKRRLGADPKGVWLAERVWDPSLPLLLGPRGVTYTMVDDAHFQLTGLKPDSLQGYYLTEREGTPLAIFPISRRLRYLIPFRPPEETIDYLSRLKERGPVGITYADDGEKFGLWPGTHRWVYDQGWLKRFLILLERNQSWLRTETFGEFLSRTRPTGRIYLPTASYEEMMEWALPVDSALEREAFLRRIEEAGLKEEAQGFLRGGLWHHFLVKYPEINWMHKRMLHVSGKLHLKARTGSSPKRVRPARPGWADSARRELYQGQGNDAYWHGLFGGYYLNYLRHAVYEHLLKAENLIPPGPAGPRIRLTEQDFDRDGQNELLAETRWMNLYLKPEEGAAAVEIDYRPKALCLTHVPMRRPEAYHRRARQQPAAADRPPVEGAGIPSIHDLVAEKEAGWDRKLVYDRYLRWSFRDHLMDAGTTLERFESGRQEDLGGFSDRPYERKTARAGRRGATLAFYREGRVKDRSLRTEKVYTLSASRARMDVKYTFESQGRAPLSGAPSVPCLWAVELNLTLLAGSDPKRYYRFPGKSVPDVRLSSRGIVESATEVHLVDEWNGIEIHLGFDPPVRFWRFPVETVSQSEKGLESIHQGFCLAALWPLDLAAIRKFEGLVTFSIAERRAV